MVELQSWIGGTRQAVTVTVSTTTSRTTDGVDMARIETPAIDRVMKKVIMLPDSGCWIFSGAWNQAGYGIVGKGGRGSGNDRAHRVTYAHFRGPIPGGMFVCHRCDVPACCNPEHLFIGTNDDNMADCRAKGRASKPPENPHVVGEYHPGHKLTEAQVREMRHLRASGWTLQSLADRYSVGDATVLKICRRDSWKHVA